MKSGDSQLIIYDIGANKGANLPYYFRKAHKVVAVEANPALVQQMKAKYEEQIEDGRLIIEDCVVSVEQDPKEVDFYIHKYHDVLSQLPPPNEDKINMFERVALRSKNIVNIIQAHGSPYYVKIDIEHYDAVLLRELFSNGIYPDYISAEYHSIDVFLRLAGEGGYHAFKLVDGRRVPQDYSRLHINDMHSQRNFLYNFPDHSAGPFGNDVKGNWYSIDEFMIRLGMEETGWKDIHCSRIDAPSVKTSFRWQEFLDERIATRDILKYSINRMKSALVKRLCP